MLLTVFGKFIQCFAINHYGGKYIYLNINQRSQLLKICFAKIQGWVFFFPFSHLFLILPLFIHKVYKVKFVYHYSYILYCLQLSHCQTLSMLNNFNGFVSMLFMIQVLWTKDPHQFQHDVMAGEHCDSRTASSSPASQEYGPSIHGRGLCPTPNP